MRWAPILIVCAIYGCGPIDPDYAAFKPGEKVETVMGEKRGMVLHSICFSPLRDVCKEKIEYRVRLEDQSERLYREFELRKTR